MIKDAKVLSKKGARKFSLEILENWKKFTPEENESYLLQNFETIWNNYDNSEGKGTGMLNLELAEKFMKELA